MLTGNDAVQNNLTNIQLLDSRYPGFAKYLRSPADFVRIPNVNQRQYPDGTNISNNLPDAYGIPAVGAGSQNCLNCKFRHNNYCSKWIAQIRKNYWCASWAESNHPNPENT